MIELIIIVFLAWLTALAIVSAAMGDAPTRKDGAPVGTTGPATTADRLTSSPTLPDSVLSAKIAWELMS